MAMTDLTPAESPAAPQPAYPSRLRDWLAPPIPGGVLAGWLGPLLVTALAGLLRFYRLGSPKAVVFDETYYAKDALSLLRFGYEHTTVKDADKMLIADPHANIWTDGGSFVVHPPAGKWMIAVGEWLFGATPFGWRFMPALCGTLAVLILARVVRRMTGSTLLGSAAGLLLALDGLSFVTGRAALLDVFVMFWILSGFGCLVVDRDKSRQRLADMVERGETSVYGPFVLHGWRIAAGICLGMAVATKWTGIFYIAAFGLMVVLWDYGARRAAGVREPLLGTLMLDAVPAFFQLVGAALVTYLVTWSGWIFNAGGWDRGTPSSNPLWRPFEAMPKLWKYHKEMLHFHNGLHDRHPYQSWPWDWPVLRRPVAFYYTEPSGCGSSKCSSEILGIGTPALWWGAIAALVVVLGIWLVTRDWRAGAAILGFTAGWLTWFPSAFDDRTMFLFYATPMVPFMIIAVVLALGYLIGPARLPGPRRVLGAAAAGAFLLVVLANFAYFYPILSAQVISFDAWHDRIWFKSWI